MLENTGSYGCRKETPEEKAAREAEKAAHRDDAFEQEIKAALETVPRGDLRSLLALKAAVEIALSKCLHATENAHAAMR